MIELFQMTTIAVTILLVMLSIVLAYSVNVMQKLIFTHRHKAHSLEIENKRLQEELQTATMIANRFITLHTGESSVISHEEFLERFAAELQVKVLLPDEGSQHDKL